MLLNRKTIFLGMVIMAIAAVAFWGLSPGSIPPIKDNRGNI